MSPDLTEAMLDGESAQRGSASWWTAVLIAGALVVSACGGGGETSDVTDPTTTPTTAAVRTSAPPTTVATTSPPTDPPATDPPVTEPPPTTLDPAALEDQIRADFERTYRAYLECVFVPPNCAYGDVNYPGSPLDVALRRTMEEFLANGLKARRQSGPIYYEIRSIELMSSGMVRVEACMVDGGVVYEERDPATSDDDVIWNDALSSTVSSWTMRAEQSRWLLHSVAQLAIYPEVEGCADSG